MPLVKYDKKEKEWKTYKRENKPEGAFYLDGYLKQILDYSKKLIRNDWDVVAMVDGIEGVGKSTLGIQVGWYMSNENLTNKNICAGTTDVADKLENLPDKSVLIIDEGSLAFSSTDFMRKEQKRLLKILNVVRQKNMFLLVIAPTFMALNKRVSLRRSRFLLHCYSKAEKRGYFEYYGEERKAKLYNIGKKNNYSYKYPPANKRGAFTKFNPLGDKYLKKKKEQLMAALKRGDKKKITQDIKKRMIKRMIKRNEKYGKLLDYKYLAKVMGVCRKTASKYRQEVIKEAKS